MKKHITIAAVLTLLFTQALTAEGCSIPFSPVISMTGFGTAEQRQ